VAVFGAVQVTQAFGQSMAGPMGSMMGQMMGPQGMAETEAMDDAEMRRMMEQMYEIMRRR
jgi:hypothetical protein